MAKNNPQPFWPVAMRGALLRCPNCGKGRLFASYLKQVEQCAVCGEAFGHIRADDGPAWLTILIVGHILAVFMLGVLPHATWPDSAIMAAAVPATLVLTLTTLPRAKGVFIGMIWRSGCSGSEKQP